MSRPATSLAGWWTYAIEPTHPCSKIHGPRLLRARVQKNASFQVRRLFSPARPVRAVRWRPAVLLVRIALAEHRDIRGCTRFGISIRPLADVHRICRGGPNCRRLRCTGHGGADASLGRPRGLGESSRRQSRRFRLARSPRCRTPGGPLSADGHGDHSASTLVTPLSCNDKGAHLDQDIDRTRSKLWGHRHADAGAGTRLLRKTTVCDERSQALPVDADRRERTPSWQQGSP